MGQAQKPMATVTLRTPDQAQRHRAMESVPETSQEGQTVEGSGYDRLVYGLLDALGMAPEGTDAYVAPHPGNEGWTVTPSGDLYREPSQPMGLMEQMKAPMVEAPPELPGTASVDVGPIDVKNKPPTMTIGNVRIMPQIGPMDIKKRGV